MGSVATARVFPVRPGRVTYTTWLSSPGSIQFHVAGKVDPIADIEVIQTELCLADLGTVEKSLHRYTKAARSGSFRRRISAS